MTSAWAGRAYAIRRYRVVTSGGLGSGAGAYVAAYSIRLFGIGLGGLSPCSALAA